MMITGRNINDTTMMTAVLEDIRVPVSYTHLDVYKRQT